MKIQTFEEGVQNENKIKELDHELETLNERYAFGKFDDDSLYQKLCMKKQSEIKQVKGKLEDLNCEISILVRHSLWRRRTSFGLILLGVLNKEKALPRFDY